MCGENTDGETARIKGTHKKYTNLVMIPVAICHMKVALYSLKNLELDNDIANYRVGHRNGSLVITQMLERFASYKITYNEQF